MKIYKAKDYADMSRKAANIISAQIIMKPECVLGLATGSTPVGLYKQLVEWYKKGDLDFSAVKTINLDEYKGLSQDNDQSYYYFMHKNLFDNVNISVDNTHIPNGMEQDSEKECNRYSELIKSLGGIDLQLLGIGHNGHIGFNEPSDSFEKQVHCVDLTESTIEANKRFFESAEDVPRQAYTMGIKTIDAQALAKSLATEIKYDDTLKELTADEISMLVDLPEDVDSVMYAGSGSTAEEVGVFTAKDSNQAKETMEDVQKYLDDQADSFQDYVPEETKRIGNAVLEQKNQYVVLCVSGDSDQAKEIIEKAFK